MLLLVPWFPVSLQMHFGVYIFLMNIYMIRYILVYIISIEMNFNHISTTFGIITSNNNVICKNDIDMFHQYYKYSQVYCNC